jgi:hypothetical protein
VALLFMPLGFKFLRQSLLLRITGFARIDQYEIVIVIAAQDKLAEKVDLLPVVAFGFRFVKRGRTQVFKLQGILFLNYRPGACGNPIK